jgi:hypothetical protein
MMNFLSRMAAVRVDDTSRSSSGERIPPIAARSRILRISRTPPRDTSLPADRIALPSVVSLCLRLTSLAQVTGPTLSASSFPKLVAAWALKRSLIL